MSSSGNAFLQTPQFNISLDGPADTERKKFKTFYLKYSRNYLPSEVCIDCEVKVG